MLEKQSIQITNNGRKLTVTVFLPDEQTAQCPAIILGAGWMNTLENNYEFAQEVSDAARAVVVVFDYSGIGSSEGKLKELSRKDHLDDFLAVYDWTKAHNAVNPELVGVNGGSYSGYLAVLLTAQRNVKSLLLRAPAVFPDDKFEVPNDMAGKRTADYYEDVVRYNKASLLRDALDDYRNPILVQEREGDTAITKPVIEFFLNNNHSALQKHTVLKGAGHKISGQLKARSTQECIDWFRETLQSAKGVV